MFESILASTSSVAAGEFVICTCISLGLGIIIAFIHSFKNEYSKNMLLALLVLPAIIQTVIMLVNGNVGTGVAVMGAFSLVRFRSTPGNAREITSIFLSTVTGLAMAMGYVGVAALLILVVGASTIAVSLMGIAMPARGTRVLKILIPENLDYTTIFDDLLEKYTAKADLDRVKSTNMGSLFELQYNVVLRAGANEKEFLDELRVRNGNLSISLGRPVVNREEL
ncbi:MAG: DUF4956 domain-containing protein [Lachnospiraceae bacterium]|nr:DUF4956 domain-containing protein [Lachnospiraceae bacterium]